MSILSDRSAPVNINAIVMVMEVALLLLVSLSLLKLIIWTPSLWRYHTTLAVAGVALEFAVAAAFIWLKPGLLSALFAVAAVYQIVNLLRVIKNRMQADYLRRVSNRSALYISGVQLLVTVLAVVNVTHVISMTLVGYTLATIQILGALVLVSSTQRHLKTTKTLQTTASYTNKELPSVSVLVPARNETDDLRRCLESLVASTYPKLEIIVLDDCSQDKHTPETIRAFAHDGVRFIAGTVPPDNWLAKNFAYQQLADAASGEYLLFCGVDLLMSPNAITELITTMLEKQKSMLSVLPQNSKPTDLRAYLIQPLRYAWELSLPRRLFNRPPVLSTCWVIKRGSLSLAGNFKAVSRSIVPESYFARSTARNDAYSFLRSNLLISNKPFGEQQNTATRMRYPQLRRRLELLLPLALIELCAIVLVLPVFVIACLHSAWIIAVLSGAAYVLFCIVLLQVTGVMYGRPALLGVFLAPVAVLYDIWVLHYSAYRYEFRDVRWKERNVCLPVMRYDTPVKPVTVAPN